MNPDYAKAMLLHLAQSGQDTPAAREVARALAKVALTPGAKATPVQQLPAIMGPGSGGKAGLFDRARQAMRYLISGVGPDVWFSPNQPLSPMADGEKQGTIGRRFDFPVGSNLNYTPRSEANAGGVPFWVLRNLAENYDLLRIVLETRKDQIASFQWEIVPKDETSDAGSFKDEIKRATEFFERPTPEHDWLEWIRAISEDDMVCGSIALYPRLNRGGQLHSLVPVDVTTIKRLIDEHGYQPEPPSPAFQSILKGAPAVDYMACTALPSTADELASLAYWVRNPRTWKLYGLSPVEQVITTVNIAMRRQQFQMEYYTEGSIPDMIIGLPEDVTPDQIKEFQTWWDSILAGNTAVRRKVRFTPEMKGIVTPKDAAVVLQDSMDEWLARVICFCFSIAPTAFIKQTNRAQSEQVAETAKEEGLMPMLNWASRKLTWVANVLLECPNIKFAWKMAEEVDPKTKSEVNGNYVTKGIITINEAREDIGKAPIQGGEKLIVITASGPVPLKEAIDRAAEDFKNPPKPPPVLGAQPGSQPTGPGGGGQQPAEEKKTEKMEMHFHAGDTHIAPPAITVNSPAVNLPAIKVDAPKLGDTHVHVAAAPAPDVFVNIEGTSVTADMRGGDKDIVKTIKVKRGSDGSLQGDVIEKRV